MHGSKKNLRGCVEEVYACEQGRGVEEDTHGGLGSLRAAVEMLLVHFV